MDISKIKEFLFIVKNKKSRKEKINLLKNTLFSKEIPYIRFVLMELSSDDIPTVSAHYIKNIEYGEVQNKTFLDFIKFLKVFSLSKNSKEKKERVNEFFKSCDSEIGEFLSLLASKKLKLGLNKNTLVEILNSKSAYVINKKIKLDSYDVPKIIKITNATDIDSETLKKLFKTTIYAVELFIDGIRAILTIDKELHVKCVDECGNRLKVIESKIKNMDSVLLDELKDNVYELSITFDGMSKEYKDNIYILNDENTFINKLKLNIYDVFSYEYYTKYKKCELLYLRRKQKLRKLFLNIEFMKYDFLNIIGFVLNNDNKNIEYLRDLAYKYEAHGYNGCILKNINSKYNPIDKFPNWIYVKSDSK